MEVKTESYLLIENKKKAYFVLLGCGLMYLLTLGLLYPVSIWLLSRYLISRKYIDGRQLAYKGKLWMCFIISYIGLALLILCVLGIQALLKYYNLEKSIPHQLLNMIPGALATFFISVQINRYNQMNTHFVDEKDKKSGYKFYLWLFLGKYVLSAVLKTLSAGLLYPISSRLSALYDFKRGYIDGYFFTYRFTMRRMYPRHLLDLLLSIVTIGFYLPMMAIRRISIDISYAHIDTRYIVENEKPHN